MTEARDPRSPQPMRRNVWYHIAAVVDQGVHKLFIDGVLADAAVHSLKTHPAQPLHIGRKGTAEPYFFFKGAIDDVRIYNRALTSAEVAELFEDGGYRKPERPRLGCLVTMLPVTDVNASIRFYQDVLGFTLVNYRKEWRWAYLSYDGCSLMLDQSICHHRPSDAVLYLYPENLRAFHQMVRSSGQDIPEITTTFYGMSEFRLKDPDGNAIWIGGTAD
jgi:catechol 2,3-dioxygenase-like lactoylglutathione lyase family enzyme